MTNALRNAKEQTWQKSLPSTQSHALEPSCGTFACSGLSAVVDISFGSKIQPHQLTQTEDRRSMTQMLSMTAPSNAISRIEYCPHEAAETAEAAEETIEEDSYKQLQTTYDTP
jgi:hypothetical protein